MASLDMTPEQQKSLQASLEKAIATLKDEKATAEELAKALGKVGVAGKKAGLDTSKATDGAVKSLHNYVEGLQDAIDEQDKLGDLVKKMPTESVTKLAKEHGRIARGLAAVNKMEAKSQKQQERKKRITEALMKRQRAYAKDVAAEASATGMGKKDILSRHAAEVKKATADVTEAFKSGQNPFEAMKGKKMATKLGVFGQIASEGSAKLAGKKGGAALMGGILKQVGGMAGGLSKVLANPIVGGIMMGVKALWDLGMAADTFVKDANKRFALIRGPDIMTPGVEKQFKEFNDQLYNMFNNLQAGMNAAQVGEFLASLTQAGVHLDSLNKGFQNYRDVVYVASKASKTLGVDTVQVGAMMGTLFLDLRMDLDKVNKTFVNVAFDAKKAGLSTDKFWGALQNATATLGFWNISMDKASKTLASFNKTQAEGATQTGDTVGEITQAYSKMDDTQRATLLGLAGGVDAAHKAMAGAKAEADKRIKKIQSKLEIAVSEGKTGDELEKIRQELVKEQTNSAQLAKAIKLNDPVALAPYLPLAGDGTIQMIQKLIGVDVDAKGQALKGQQSLADATGEQLWVMKAQLEAAGLPTDLLMKIQKVTMSIGNEQSNQLDELAKRVTGASEDTREGIAEKLGNLEETFKTTDFTSDESIEAQEDISRKLQESLKVDSGTADGIARLVALDSSGEVLETLKDQMRAGKLDTTVLKKILKENKIADKAAAKGGNISNKLQEDMNDAAQDTFQKVRDQTLSLQDQLDIAKDDIKWKAASLGLAQGLNNMVFDIAKKYLGAKSYKTVEQKAAIDKTKRAGYKGPTEVEDTKSAQAMSAEFKRSGIAIRSLTAVVSESQKTSESLQKALDETDPNQAIKDLTRASEMQKKAYDSNIEDQRKALIKGVGGKGGIDPAVAAKMTAEQIVKSMAPEQAASTQAIAESINQMNTANKTLQDNIARELANFNAQSAAADDELLHATTEDAKNQAKARKKKIQDDHKTALNNFKKPLLDAKKVADDQMKTAGKQLQVEQDSFQALAGMYQSNKQIAKIQTLLAMNTKEGNDAVAQQISDMADQGMDPEDIAKATGLTKDEMEKSLEKAGKVISKPLWAQKMTNLGNMEKAGLKDAVTEAAKSAGSAPAHAPGEQNLKVPQKITSPGPVTLHPGETVLPKSFAKMQARDIMGEAAKGAPGGAGGTPNISISVNATEKDLAQKIANEVRGVLYKQQIAGMGA